LRAGTLVTQQTKKTVGWKIRDAVGYLEEKVGPHVKKIIPTFIVAHYVYIITFAILGSIVMYPVKDAKYIDLLFFASGAATQAGLNTIDLNSIKLYQQITIYILCMLTTPIFIHGSLCALRLYWFERYFDDIREKSKLDFKMRRTATLAGKTQSIDRSRTMESISQPQGPNPSPPTSGPSVSPENKLGSSSTSEASLAEPRQLTASAMDLYRQDVTHISEPSSDDDESLLPEQRNTNVGEIDNTSDQDKSINIKFGELPKPKREEFEPKDVMMSIAMMQNSRSHSMNDTDDEGPALVIHGPAERESSSRSSNIQFDLKNPLHMRKRSGIRRSLLRGEPPLNGFGIDSVIDDSNIESDGDDLTRAHSHLQLPSSDLSGGVKFAKRSNTMDVDEEATLGKIPKFVKHRLKKTKALHRRLSSSAVDDSSMNPDDSETDEDDEEDDEVEQRQLKRQMSTNYLSWTPTIGRNSTFVNLSQQQKEELGGVEYRAVKVLIKIIAIYYVGFHILAFVFMVPWINETPRYQPVVRESGVSLTWWGFFTSASAFNDLGFTLTPDSMISFKTSPYVLLILGFFVVIGNTGFPILLRFIIWIMFKFSKELSQFRESVGFLLDHPRRCFTLLFPSGPTWWLFFILIFLNIVDLVLFIILDLDAKVVEELTTGQKILDGLFQAISTRTAGFACVDLSQLHPAVQVSYMVMMYISVLPLAISIRRTNVYEEQSLGVYGGHGDDHVADEKKATSFIGAHLRKQLSFDLWFVFLGLFIICIAEGTKIQDPLLPSFNVFSVMFEVVSAYGTVGLSLGYPNTTPSFSGQFTTLSKVIIIAMMIRGRHRGLPYSLDRAIMLPSEKMEEQDRYQDLHAGNHLNHSETIGSVNDPVIEFFKSAAPKVIRDRIKRPSFFSHRSSVSTHGPRVPRSSTIASSSYARPTSETQTSSDFFTNRPAENYEFKDVHFDHHAHLSDTNPRDEISPIDTPIELDDITPSEFLDHHEGGEPVHRAETEIASSSADMAERSNSVSTL
jgi:potassium uptake Trk family protein